MTAVYVAAGGGGDALAAAIVHRALGHTEPAVIATYAWDRLAVDPLPGPRSAADFIDLALIGHRNHVVTSSTAARPPAGSTLPRLAADLTDTLVLLDPASGATGMRAQLAELADTSQAETLTVLDVGGDVVARGDEPGLRSPLADGLALAACLDLSRAVSVLVAGPGLDGELAESDVLGTAGSTPAVTLREPDVAGFRTTFDWHPSEATALLAAAARGVRGRVEVRDAGLPVTLTDRSPCVFSIPIDRAAAANRLAYELAATESLDEAEAIARKVCGVSEIDYERAKARDLSERSQPAEITAQLDQAIWAFEREARARGVEFVTFRRIAEAVSLAPAGAAELRGHLIATRPDQYVWPIWMLR